MRAYDSNGLLASITDPLQRSAMLENDVINDQDCPAQILEVLSGEKPVTDAIEQAKISRGHYYQLEERALKAILTAMEPGTSAGRPPETTTRLLQLEEKVKELEGDKRRLERLLSMTRKVLRPGPLKSWRGRPSSAKDGKSASPSSSERRASQAAGSPTSSSDPSTR